MKIREITENVMPTIQTKTVTQAVMPDGSVADLDTDAGNKSTGTLFQDKDGNIGIAEPGKAKATGKPEPREMAIKIINNAKNNNSIY